MGTLEDNLEAALVPNVVVWTVLSVPCFAQGTPLFSELHWIPIAFVIKGAVYRL